jgi:hypothetical protein
MAVETGGVINFQTVNSLLRNSITQQSEYIGTGQTYNMGLGYSVGTVLGIEITERLEFDMNIEYMLKRVRVNFQSRTNSKDHFYLFDLNYHYFRIPATLKIKKAEKFNYEIGFVNNFFRGQ